MLLDSKIKRKLIGATLLAVPFTVMSVFMVANIGWKAAGCVLGSILAAASCIYLGVKMLVD